MKQYINKNLGRTSLCVLSFLCALCAFTACDDYLDVTPSDKQTAAQVFANKAGFYTVANGIYDGLASDDLYGKQMTWEAIDIVSQGYRTSNSLQYMKSLAASNYTDNYASPVLASIWTKAYELIMNANLLIDQIEKQKGMLTATEADILKGEMLAVRAFLHLDMLRLFGPTPVNGLDQLAIPYNESVDVFAHDLISIEEAGKKIIRDLDAAEQLLQQDPIIENGPMMSPPEGDESVQLRYRQYRMNYYTVIALKARAYLWVGDFAHAKEQALRLINDQKVQKMFPAVDPNKLLANTSNPDRVFSSEVLMGIYDKDRNQVFTDYFASSAARTQRLQPRADFITGTYGLFANLFIGVESNDYRYQTQWEAASGTGAEGHSFIKYKEIDQPDPDDEDSEYYYAKMIPLVKMQEMYLIACECSESVAEKVYWLNQARIRRGLYDIEMLGLMDYYLMYWDYGYGNVFVSNEYRREFWGEGQWFYFAKRVDIVGYGIGAGYYFDNGADMSVAQFDVKPPLPAGEMK